MYVQRDVKALTAALAQSATAYGWRKGIAAIYRMPAWLMTPLLATGWLIAQIGYREPSETDSDIRLSDAPVASSSTSPL